MGRVRPIKRSPPAIQDAVDALLVELAPALLDARITPARVCESIKRAMVGAASPRARMRSGRVNHSQIATLTGLTRVEVRRLLAASPRATRGTAAAARAGHADRAARVVSGWLTDRAFVTREGRPRTLVLRSGANSFADLVRRHSGDMPAAAVLRELQRLKAVKVSAGAVRLIRRRPLAVQPTADALLEAMPQVANLLAQLRRPDVAVAYSHHALLPAADEVTALMLANRARLTLAASVAALQPGGGRSARSQRANTGDGQNAVGVTVIVTSPKRRRRNGSAREV